MSRSFALRRLFLSSVHSSSSSTIPCPNLVRSSLFLSSSNYSSTASSFWTFEGKPSSVRASVWWNFKDCKLPTGVDAVKVAPVITAALRTNGINGPVEFNAFGDVLQLGSANRVPIHLTGINFVDVPEGQNNNVDYSLEFHLMAWVYDNPPPAHLFLITDDSGFAELLHRLRLRNYNMLLASNNCAPAIVRSATTIMWRWNSMVRGENLTGTHYNYPPDGPYDSWYGQFEAPIEDPFLEAPESTPDSIVRSS